MIPGLTINLTDSGLMLGHIVVLHPHRTQTSKLPVLTVKNASKPLSNG